MMDIITYLVGYSRIILSGINSDENFGNDFSSASYIARYPSNSNFRVLKNY